VPEGYHGKTLTTKDTKEHQGLSTIKITPLDIDPVKSKIKAQNNHSQSFLRVLIVPEGYCVYPLCPSC
jgi:hypothetical protein